MRARKNPRLREIMSALVRHLHEFAREVKLTEEEFQAAIAYIVALGQHTNETHNEAVLMAGSLGFSPLVCLLNNGDRGQTETDANLLGPFWRMDSPRDRERRLDRALADAGAGAVRRRLVPRSSTASRSQAPRSTSGIPRPKAFTRTRIRCRPT